MMYGTIKTEVWANMPDMVEDYFRYEIITRWRPAEATQVESGIIKWSTHITMIDRDGNYKPVVGDSSFSNWWENWITWLNNHHIEKMMNGFEARSEMRAEHDYAIRLCIG